MDKDREDCKGCDRAKDALDRMLVWNRQLLEERNRYKAAIEEIDCICHMVAVPPCKRCRVLHGSEIKDKSNG